MGEGLIVVMINLWGRNKMSKSRFMILLETKKKSVINDVKIDAYLLC